MRSRRRPLRLIARIVAVTLAAVAVVAAVGFVANRRADIPLETLKQRWTDGSSRFLSLDGMQVHYRDEGSGPLVVLVHGTSSSLHTWDGWAAALRDRWRVVRVDLPGFGLTGPSPARDYRIAAYVTFIDRFLERVAGGAPCALAGNSLGGNIAWEYALAHPSRVRALVLVDSAGYPLVLGGAAPLAFRVARWPVVADLLAGLDPRRLVEDGVRRVYGDPSRIRPGVIERYYELTLRPGNRRAFVERMRSWRDDDAERIKEIRTPTLVLWGARDRLLPVEDGRRFARDIAGARLVIYDDLGHVPMEEDPARTVLDVEGFLNAR